MGTRSGTGGISGGGGTDVVSNKYSEHTRHAVMMMVIGSLQASGSWAHVDESHRRRRIIIYEKQWNGSHRLKQPRFDE